MKEERCLFPFLVTCLEAATCKNFNEAQENVPLDTFSVINQAFSFQMTSGQSYSSFETLKISPSD